MGVSLQNDSSDQMDYPEELSIVFFGKELFYSNQTLRSVQNEFGVRAFRGDSLEALEVQSAHADPAGRIVVVDQMMLEDLLARPSEYTRLADQGCLAFAYRKKKFGPVSVRALGPRAVRRHRISTDECGPGCLAGHFAPADA